MVCLMSRTANQWGTAIVLKPNTNKTQTPTFHPPGHVAMAITSSGFFDWIRWNLDRCRLVVVTNYLHERSTILLQQFSRHHPFMVPTHKTAACISTAAHHIKRAHAPLLHQLSSHNFKNHCTPLYISWTDVYLRDLCYIHPTSFRLSFFYPWYILFHCFLNLSGAQF